MRKHALVVGGTGMLAYTTLWLLEQGFHVSVIGRSNRRLQALQKRAADPSQLTGISVNYEDDASLRRELTAAIEQNGPVTLVVAWIHSTAPNALSLITEEVSRAGEWHLYHVQGSNAYLERDRKPLLPANCVYHKVILGFVLEGSKSRWHHNQEIAAGVIRALEASEDLYIVGTCEPWEKRP